MKVILNIFSEVRTCDGVVPWPPAHVSARQVNGKWVYAAYPGRINNQALGWVRIYRRHFRKAVSQGSQWTIHPALTLP